MQTNKIPLPSFIDAKATGTVSVSMQFESAPTINYTIYAKRNEVYSDAKFEDGIDKFTAFNHVFKLSTSNLSIDPINGKKVLSANFTATRPTKISEELRLEKIKNGENIFEVDQIGISGTTISSNDILSLEVNYSANNRKEWEFTPARLSWGESEYAEDDDGNPITNKPIFEVIPQVETVVVNDPENAATAPNNSVIKDFSMNFDQSGTTKTRETNVYKGTVLRKKLVEVFGYAYLSDQANVTEYITPENGGRPTPKFNSANYQNFWGLVQWYVITYNYDETGYYLGYDKKGSKKVRYQREEYFEITDLTLQTTPPATEEANLYRFFWTPIVEYERLELHAYHNYYEDAKTSINDLYIMYEDWDINTQKYMWKFEKNKEYVLPMFVKQQLNYSRCFSYKFLDFDQQKNKLFTTGEESKVLTTCNILQTARAANPNVAGGDAQTQESYELLNETVNSQDDNFRNFLKETTSESNFGRPPQADFYPVYQLEQPEEQNLNETKPKVDPIIYIAKKQGDVVNLKDKNLQIGEFYYEKADSARETLNRLKFELRKSLLFQGDEFVVTCLYQPNIKVNELLSCSYRGRSYRGIVKSVDHNIEILGRNVGKGFTTVTVAMENQKNNMWKDITLQNEANPDLPVNVWTPPLYNPTFTSLGNVSDIKALIESLPARGNV